MSDEERQEPQVEQEQVDAASDELPVHPLVQGDPERYRTLKNGAVYDNEAKKIVAMAAGGGPKGIKSKAHASALANTRWQMVERAQLAARKGLADISGTKSSLAAWSSIVKEQAQLAKDIEKGRHSTEAARFVGQATGFMSDRRGNGDEKSSGATLHMSNDALAQVLTAIAQARGGNSDILHGNES